MSNVNGHEVVFFVALYICTMPRISVSLASSELCFCKYSVARAVLANLYSK